MVSATALAIALPMNVAGFFLLRLVKDLKLVSLEQVTVQAFQEVGFTTEELGASEVGSEAIEKKRTETMLAYSYTLLMFSAVLTVVGMAAALWHVAWWIGVAFVVMSVAAQVIVSLAFRSTRSRLTWRPPSDEKEPRPTQR